MLRFLKWIFLIFGGLAFGILTFFFIQNKHDLMTAWDHKSELSYSSIKGSCLDVEKEYYYPCFRKSFLKYLDKVSMTGTSLGLKMAFNFIDEDKMYTKKFSSTLERDLTYSLNYLELNNFAISQSYKRFFGLEFTYGGFVGKVKENLDKADIFSNGIIDGLRGKEGISKLKSLELQKKLNARLEALEADFNHNKKNVQTWLDAEIKILDKKYNN